jgi:hypothetical protein
LSQECCSIRRTVDRRRAVAGRRKARRIDSRDFPFMVTPQRRRLSRPQEFLLTRLSGRRRTRSARPARMGPASITGPWCRRISVAADAPAAWQICDGTRVDHVVGFYRKCVRPPTAGSYVLLAAHERTARRRKP